MCNYESVIIMRGTFTEDEYKHSFNKIKEFFTKYKVEKVEEIGKKKLAYQVNDNTEGYYIIIYFETEREDIAEIERYYRLNEDILKFITVKKD